jgi:hypothetical protein
MVSQDEGRTFAAFSRGLPTGAFVKEGAHVRANADGNLFLAAVNNMLYVGRRYTGSFDVSDISASPALCSFRLSAYRQAMPTLTGSLGGFRTQRSAAAAARGMIEQFEGVRGAISAPVVRITARIVEQGATPTTGPAQNVPASVCVDLTRLGGPPREPMYDDGAHGDAAGGDGLYGTGICIRPDRLTYDARDRRRPWPGPLALTVTAIGDDGALSSGIAVLQVINRLESSDFWLVHNQNWDAAAGAAAMTVEDAPSPVGKTSLKLALKDSPWVLPLWAGAPGRSVRGYDAVSFWVRTDRAGKELNVHLRDTQTDVNPPLTTPGVPAVKEGLVEGGPPGPTWRRVVVPISRLLRDSPKLRPTQVEYMVLSGEGSPGQNYWISDVRLIASPKDPPKSGGAP